MININLILFLISCFLVSFFYKHILLNLISLEFLMINIFNMMIDIMNILNYVPFFLNFFLTISICEGVMGLSILVYMIRNMGNDFSKTLVLIKW